MERRTKYKYCFVPHCKCTTVNTPDKIFLAIPGQNLKRKRSQWFQAVRRDESIVSQNSDFYCCQDHFNLKEDMANYYYYETFGGRIKLKEDVVPHIFDCQPDRKRRAGTAVLRPLSEKRQRATLVDDLIAASSLSTSSTHVRSDSCAESEESAVPTEALLENVEKRDVGVTARPSFRSKYVTCKIRPASTDAASSPKQILKTDAMTSPCVIPYQRKPISDRTACSFTDTSVSTVSTSSYNPSLNREQSDSYSCSSDSENVEYKQLASKIRIHHINNNLKMYLGLPKEWLKLISLLQTRTHFEVKHIYLTLMKIKTNDSFQRLGIEFGISTSYASKIFSSCLLPLSHILKELVYWPPKHLVKMLLPIPFRTKYSDVVSIIDCFEIEIQKPSDSVKQAHSWSEYKHCNTLKYLVSATPDGLVNYVSEGYGGRTPDLVLFESCGYLDIVPVGSTVMADRGFKHIETLLQRKGCILLRPPSVSSLIRPSRADVLETKRIASLRIHIENIIRRFREFKMLGPHSCIDNNLIHKTDNIVTIASALINIQSPIINQGSTVNK